MINSGEFMKKWIYARNDSKHGEGDPFGSPGAKRWVVMRPDKAFKKYVIERSVR